MSAGTAAVMPGVYEPEEGVILWDRRVFDGVDVATVRDWVSLLVPLGRLDADGMPERFMWSVTPESAWVLADVLRGGESGSADFTEDGGPATTVTIAAGPRSGAVISLGVDDRSVTFELSRSELVPFCDAVDDAALFAARSAEGVPREAELLSDALRFACVTALELGVRGSYLFAMLRTVLEEEMPGG